MRLCPHLYPIPEGINMGEMADVIISLTNTYADCALRHEAAVKICKKN
jgi:hypothetical protein